MRKRLKKIGAVLAYIILGMAIGGTGSADAELSTKLQAVESELSELQTEYDSIVEEKEELQMNYDSIVEENTTLETELESYENQEEKVEELEEELEEIQVEYKNLIEENENLEEEIEEIQTASVVIHGGDMDLTEEPAYEETEEDNYEYTVWLSATGEKYHSIPNCGRMNPNKAREVYESDAIASGYEACSKCF